MRYPTEPCKFEVLTDAALVPHGLLPLQIALLTGQEPGRGVDPLAGGDRDLGSDVDLVEEQWAGVVCRHVIEAHEVEARGARGGGSRPDRFRVFAPE